MSENSEPKLIAFIDGACEPVNPGGTASLTPSGVVKLERVRVICPACGQQVEAIARDGRVKGYCAVARQYVDFLVETQRVRIGKNPTETRAKRGQDLEVNGVVRDYLAGDKVEVIESEYNISPGALYRLLHASHVRLRTDNLDKQPS